jgi:hypothetical protein
VVIGGLPSLVKTEFHHLWSQQKQSAEPCSVGGMLSLHELLPCFMCLLPGEPESYKLKLTESCDFS